MILVFFFVGASSVKQFNTFKLEWTTYARMLRSRCREYMLDQYKVNYMLNYELLASIPNTVVDTISKAMGYKIEMVPTADLLVESQEDRRPEAVEYAQQAMVQHVDEITGVEQLDIVEMDRDVMQVP